MLENADTMFDNMISMMKKLKKASYEKNMKVFRETYGCYLDEMTRFIDEAEEKEHAAKEIAAVFIDKVQKRYEVKGRINGRTQADMNFFMIYYVFPAILLTGNQHAVLLAEAICSEWGERFKSSKIRYADYDTIYGAFREKIFGIF